MSDLLDRQLQMTRETWATLVSHGFRPGDSARLDFTFVADTQAVAGALAASLQAGSAEEVKNYQFEELWVVEGRSTQDSLQLDALERWVKELVLLGEGCGAEFDGWGMELPE